MKYQFHTMISNPIRMGHGWQLNSCSCDAGKGKNPGKSVRYFDKQTLTAAFRKRSEIIEAPINAGSIHAVSCNEQASLSAGHLLSCH